jgi:23S rRNA pseudouridine1911/1915/1917 synthase
MENSSSVQELEEQDLYEHFNIVVDNGAPGKCFT